MTITSIADFPAHQAPSASTRLIRLEGPALIMAKLLTDVSNAGCTPQVVGIPTTPRRIALLVWCSTPGDVVPIIRIATHTYDVRPMFGPLSALPEWDTPASVLVTGKALWRWLVKQSQKAVA